MEYGESMSRVEAPCGRASPHAIEEYILYDRAGENKRVIHVNNKGKMTITMYNVAYLTINTRDENDKQIKSIDPDGGPYMYPGMRFGSMKIDTIDSYEPIDDETYVVHGSANLASAPLETLML